MRGHVSLCPPYALEPNALLGSCDLRPFAELGSCREIESAAGSKAETVMQEKIGYCRQKAAECAARAQEAADRDTRELFLRFRNSWLNAAKRYESSGAAAPDESPERRPSCLPPSSALATGVSARTTRARTRRRSGSERPNHIGFRGNLRHSLVFPQHND